MKPKVIKTEEENAAALARVERLMEMEETPAVAEELELLATLIQLYEEKTYPTPSLEPLEAIRFRMEQFELKQKDLIPFIGSKSKVSEVLHGKRSLSIAMVKRLNEGLGIPLEVLLEMDQSYAKVAEEHPGYGAEGTTK